LPWLEMLFCDGEKALWTPMCSQGFFICLSRREAGRF